LGKFTQKITETIIHARQTFSVHCYVPPHIRSLVVVSNNLLVTLVTLVFCQQRQNSAPSPGYPFAI